MKMFGFDLPVKQSNLLFHWGTMDAKNVHVSNHSYEGNNLSLSECPDEWLGLLNPKIKRELFEFEKKSGVFIDILSILNDDKFSELRNNFLTLSLKEGLLKETDVYRYEFCDDNDRPCYEIFKSKDECLEEVDQDEFDENVEVVKEYVATEKLLMLLGLDEKCALLCGLEYAIIENIRSNCLNVDGIYWNYDFSPRSYSLPLYCIFPAKVREWNFKSLKS